MASEWITRRVRRRSAWVTRGSQRLPKASEWVTRRSQESESGYASLARSLRLSVVSQLVRVTLVASRLTVSRTSVDLIAIAMALDLVSRVYLRDAVEMYLYEGGFDGTACSALRGSHPYVQLEICGDPKGNGWQQNALACFKMS